MLHGSDIPPFHGFFRNYQCLSRGWYGDQIKFMSKTYKLHSNSMSKYLTLKLSPKTANPYRIPFPKENEWNTPLTSSMTSWKFFSPIRLIDVSTKNARSIPPKYSQIKRSSEVKCQSEYHKVYILLLKTPNTVVLYKVCCVQRRETPRSFRWTLWTNKLRTNLQTLSFQGLLCCVSFLLEISQWIIKTCSNKIKRDFYTLLKKIMSSLWNGAKWQPLAITWIRNGGGTYLFMTTIRD